MSMYGVNASVPKTLILSLIHIFGVYRIEDSSEPFEDMIDKAQLAEHYYAQNKLCLLYTSIYAPVKKNRQKTSVFW